MISCCVVGFADRGQRGGRILCNELAGRVNKNGRLISRCNLLLDAFALTVVIVLADQSIVGIHYLAVSLCEGSGELGRKAAVSGGLMARPAISG